MASDNILEQVRRFQCNNLRKVSTRVTAQDGRQFVESLNSCGAYSSTSVGSSRGYVLDLNADITVAIIAPRLLLGSQDVAMELGILEDCNVTHILNVGYQIPNYYESKFVYKNVDILDDPGSHIRLFFDGCFEFIDDARQQGCVLVHCNAGVSRAPTIVIAYLMNRNRMRFKEAYDFVKNIRSCIRPNDGFMKALQDYDKELFDTGD